MHEPDSQADEPSRATGKPGGGSIFGNLPKERPGSRSPLRASRVTPPAKTRARAKATKRPLPPRAARATKPTEAPKAPPASQPTPPPPSAAVRPSGTEAPLRREGSEPIGGIEDLAWAGVTVAAQAATAGVKLASRALEVVRKSVDRP